MSGPVVWGAQIFPVPPAAEPDGRPRVRVHLRPDGHRCPHPGFPHRGQPGGAHQGGRDLPPAEGGETLRDPHRLLGAFPRGGSVVPGPVPGSLGRVLSVWLNVPGSPEQPRAAGAPHGEGRAEETLFPRPLRLVPPGHGHRASLSLYFQVRAGTSSPFPRKGLVWAVLSSAGDAQARNSQSVSRLHAWLLSLASPWSFGRELGRARSPSSPILSRPLSPPRAAPKTSMKGSLPRDLGEKLSFGSK